jgi:hypothetical protein
MTTNLRRAIFGAATLLMLASAVLTIIGDLIVVGVIALIAAGVFAYLFLKTPSQRVKRPSGPASR